MSGQHNQQARQLNRKQRKQAADRRSQIAARSETGQQLNDDQTDEEEECHASDQVNQQRQREGIVPRTGSLDERPQGRSRSLSGASERSVALSEQVITSLQVNSKKAIEPVINNKNLAATATTETPSKSLTPFKNGQNKQCIQNSRAAKHVLDPSGALYYHWSMVVSFAFLYNFWSLSYRFAFREIDFDTVAFWFALDYSADIIYILDVVINSRTGYLEDGVLQRNKDKISVHYRECTLFYLDCFCLLPLDILYLSIGFNSILRCTRLVKIYKFWSYVDRTERHTNYPNVFRTFTLVHYILVIFHWNACLFHMISKNKIIDIEDLYKINDNRCLDVLCQYLHAFYWSTLALTTIGDLPRPRTKGEYVFIIVELFFGLFLFASVLGHVANIVTNVSAARKEFQAKLDAVKTFMRMRRVSDELQSKVIRWFDYLWISQKSSDEERSVACLPDRLKAEIAIHVHLDTLKRVDIFQNTEAGFLCELVLRLKPVLFSPGDYVCRKNEVGHEMYIVSRGILEVVTDEGKTVVATLKAGSYFGEISVLNVGLAGNKRTASVRSVGYSDLFCLNKQDLWDVLKNYPNAEARIRARAEERLNKLDINQSRGSGMQTSSKMEIKSLKGSKLRSVCDLDGTTASIVTGNSAKLAGYNKRKQRNIGARSNLINNRHHIIKNNKQTLNSLWRQNHQSSGHCQDLFDRYGYDEDTVMNHRKCCLSNQASYSLKYQPACDNNTMMSIINNNQTGFQNKAPDSYDSSQESLSDVPINCSSVDQNKQYFQQTADGNNLIHVESVDEIENTNNKEMNNKFKNNTDFSSKHESQITQNQKAKQRKQQNYSAFNSDQCNRNIPPKLLSGSTSSGLERRDCDRDRDQDRQHNNEYDTGFRLCRPDQLIGCEQNVKYCQHQYSMDDNYIAASKNRPIRLRRHLERRTGGGSCTANQSMRHSQCHHPHRCDERDFGQQAPKGLTTKRQPIMTSSSAAILAEQPPTLWLPDQTPIYAASRMETLPKQYQEPREALANFSRAVGPIIQVPMLATPTQDGRLQYLQPIIGNNNPQSLSMTHLNIGSTLNLRGQVSPRSVNQMEGQFLFVDRMNSEGQSSRSSQSIQTAQVRQQQQQQTDLESQTNKPCQREEEELNPRQTTSIDGSLESEIITGGNLRLEEYSRDQQTQDSEQQQFKIEMSEPIVDSGAKLPESGHSSNDLSELPFENPNKNPTK